MALRAETQYQIEVTANGVDLTTYLTKLRIVQSVSNTWAITYLHFMADNQEIIQHNIFGQNLIEFKLWVTAENGDKIGDSEVSMSLIYLESNLDLPAKNQLNLSDRREDLRRPIIVACVNQQSYTVMSSFVNKLWQEEAQKTPYDFVDEVITSLGFKGDAIMNADGINEGLVNQFLVPPMTFNNFVQFTHERLGIFKGPMHHYCNYAGQYQLWDLNKKFEREKNTPKIKIYKLPSYTPDESLFQRIMDEVKNDPSHKYITYDEIETIYFGNSNVIDHGYKSIYIAKPTTDLYYFHNKELPVSVSEEGLWHEKDAMKIISDKLKNRKRYYTDSVGHQVGAYLDEFREEYYKSKIAANFMNSYGIKMKITGNIRPLHLIHVGEVMEYFPYQDFETDFPDVDISGAYLTHTVDLEIAKESLDGKQYDNFGATAYVLGVRTVQTKR